jgi:hypothetical protein
MICAITNEIACLLVYGFRFVDKSDFDNLSTVLSKIDDITIYKHKNLIILDNITIFKHFSFLFSYSLYDNNTGKFKFVYRYSKCYRLIKNKLKK